MRILTRFISSIDSSKLETMYAYHKYMFIKKINDKKKLKKNDRKSEMKNYD